MQRVRYTGNLKKLTDIGIEKDLRLEVGTLLGMTPDAWCIVEYEFDCPITTTGKIKEKYDIHKSLIEYLK